MRAARRASNPVRADEYERVVGPTLTIGAVGTAWSLDEFDYRSAELKARYYPDERAPAGFPIGGSVGAMRVREDDGDPDDRSDTGLSVGCLANRGRLLGRERELYVGLGIGAKRVFLNDETFTGDLLQRDPTYRLAVGYAF